MKLLGGPLREGDYESLYRSWITRELADAALLRRVESAEGADLVGRRNNGTYSGILFPYMWPGEDSVREYYLRRDQPDREPGQGKDKQKYLGPPGRGNKLYFAPATDPALLSDAGMPIAITEGAKKTLSLFRLAHHAIDHPRFLPIGLNGVWGWRGTAEKVTEADGSRGSRPGPIPDLNRVEWRNRTVKVIFDTNVTSNRHVALARLALTDELRKRGANVLWVKLADRRAL